MEKEIKAEKKYKFMRPVYKQELKDGVMVDTKQIIDYKTEMLDLERWVWVARYGQNDELHQFDKDGNFHQIGEVDQSRVKVFVLYNTSIPEKRIDIVVPEGAKLIHKYRHIWFNHGTKDEKRVKIYMFGYKFNGHQHINYIMPDDRVVIAVDDKLDVSKQV
jgi:hypothetical protein